MKQKRPRRTTTQNNGESGAPRSSSNGSNSGRHLSASSSQRRRSSPYSGESSDVASATILATAKGGGGGGDYGSILFTLLLLGLIFCLMDVAYLLSYVDTQQQQQTQAQASAKNTDIANTADGLLPPYSKNNSPQTVTTNNAKRNKRPVRSSELEQEVNLDDCLDPSDCFSTDPLSPHVQDPTHPAHDKGPILKILLDAGIPHIRMETLQKLPTWSQVTKLYGDHPRIYGLDTCQTFQDHSDRADHFVSTAGPFNSGTNLMAELLIHNCHNAHRQAKYGFKNRGVRWQVPWGKHNPPLDEAFRDRHKTQKDYDVEAHNVMPAVTIRDPYAWMRSMCRHAYTTHWAHNPERSNCPNLKVTPEDYEEFPRLKGKEAPPVWVRYGGTKDNPDSFIRNHTSLAHMWNDWYQDYVEADFPRIIVRFEDLIFFAKQTTEKVCRCAGGQLDKHHPFQYQVASAKKGLTAHGDMQSRTGFVDAIVKYGKEDGRTSGFTEGDLEYARKWLDRDLMEFFGYLDPPINGGGGDAGEKEDKR